MTIEFSEAKMCPHHLYKKLLKDASQRNVRENAGRNVLKEKAENEKEIL